jgi:hypothetical protein
MTTQHTPGPWQAHRLDDFSSAVHSRAWEGDPSKLSVCDGHSVEVTSKQHEADARLIAAAPELLAALRRAEHAMSVVAAVGISEALEVVRAAIQKATNGQG